MCSGFAEPGKMTSPYGHLSLKKKNTQKYFCVKQNTLNMIADINIHHIDKNKCGFGTFIISWHRSVEAGQI